MSKKTKPKKNYKKRLRNSVLIFLIIGVPIGIYCRYNFENDKQTFIGLINDVANGDIKIAYKKMDSIQGFSNPLVNARYHFWKKDIDARFISNQAIFENTSGNKFIHDISNIYRDYWRTELLKDNSKERNDSSLYNNLANYLLKNNLTEFSEDSLYKTIRDDSELKRIIEQEGFKSKFIYRNGFQDIFIWDEETTEDYMVILPKDTVNVTVIFIENYHIYGYDNFASIGSSQVGGWALKESATLYCTKNGYDLNSEKFSTSFLKHESLHFTDLNAYPNLSSSDLEYRAKVVELMYYSEDNMYDKIFQFISGADSSFRSHSHPYANYCLIKNLSKILFDSEFEDDYAKWQTCSVESINAAATSLFEKSELQLAKDKQVSTLL
ncbi:MAG: hypothetical protein AB8B74_15015 [Crocinitomicaceae bacterium]